MCRGVPQESIHTRSPFHLSLLHEQSKRSPHPEHHHDDRHPHNAHGDANPAAHDHQCPNKTAAGDLISRGNPVLPRPPLGLAIVAAIHHQSQLSADCVSSASIIRRQLPTEQADQQFKRASAIELKVSERKNGSSALKRSSIFSITLESPLDEDADCSSNSCDGRPNYDFLGACFFCTRLLGSDKDVYMYRGDRAFCSSECRYQHIVADERAESRRQRARPSANQRPPAVPQPVKICRSIAVLT